MPLPRSQRIHNFEQQAPDAVRIARESDNFRGAFYRVLKKRGVSLAKNHSIVERLSSDSLTPAVMDGAVQDLAIEIGFSTEDCRALTNRRKLGHVFDFYMERPSAELDRFVDALIRHIDLRLLPSSHHASGSRNGNGDGNGNGNGNSRRIRRTPSPGSRMRYCDARD